MGSAVDKVLATPELLEQILIFATNQPLGYKKAYKLQRVNKTFNDTIQGSLQLQRRMLRAYKNGPIPKNIRSPLLSLAASRQLAILPFQAHECSIDGVTIISLNLAFGREVFSKIGMVSDVAERAESSWHGIKLSFYPAPTRVLFQIPAAPSRKPGNVDLNHSVFKDNSWKHKEKHYEYSVEYAVGRGTLGDVVDVLKEIDMSNIGHRFCWWTASDSAQQVSMKPHYPD